MRRRVSCGWACAGAVARRTIGFTVLGGMVAATSLAIFIVPVLFVLISKVAYGKKRLAYLAAHHDELLERQKTLQQQNIDPALEFDLKHKDNGDGKTEK